MPTAPLLAAFALLALAPLAGAQIFAVSFDGERNAARYKQHLVRVDGRDVLVGEVRSGVDFDETNNRYVFDANGRFELFLADPEDPRAVPYNVEDGVKVVTNRRQVVGVQGAHVQRLWVLIERESLAGLALEYQVRLAELEERTALRNQATKASPEWFSAHGRMLGSMERLRSWLANTAYPKAALKLAGQIERERKQSGADAAALRLNGALAAIREVPVPEELIAASQALTGGRLGFTVAESQSLRIVAADGVPKARVLALLELGERVIASFRADTLDPYQSEDFVDTIPAGLLSEFWMGPADVRLHERFFEQYYGQVWGPRREQRLESAGTRVRLAGAPSHLDYFRVDENSDLEGILLHGLGHHLAAAHYGENRPAGVADWLSEAVALYLSLEHIGRNSVTCRAFAPPSRYVEPTEKQEAQKTEAVGLRGFFNALALAQGIAIDRLAIKDLFAMDDADLAKGWSFYEYLVRREGRRGQELLRAASAFARAERNFVPSWRKAAEELWGFSGGDVFRHIDDLWREYASKTQRGGTSARR